MTDSDVTYTEETCDNCGAGLIKIQPEETPGDAVACIYCPPDQGCGMVDRYVDEDGNTVEP